jgi:uncharacterized protein (TIGR04255 family)
MADESRSKALPSFEHPPVVEVAVGVHFLQLPGLNTVALVRLADMWSGRFPVSQEQPPLPPVIPGGGGQMFSLQFQNALPPLRLWLLTEDEAFLVQIQHDRLLLNWRKVKPDDPYPRYTTLRRDLSELWTEFVTYVAAGDYGVLQPNLAEVTFFNRIPAESAADVPTWIAALNPTWSIDSGLATALQLEAGIHGATGQPQGQQSIALGYRPELGGLQLEITSRYGVDTGPSDSSTIMSALDEAHEAGVLAFDHITTDEAHNIWGKHDVSDN